MRARLAAAVILILTLILVVAGCGTRFELPTETRGLYSTDKAYQMEATWTNMSGIADILFIQGSGAQLFLLFTEGGEFGRGRVESYALRAKPPTPAPLGGITFRTLYAPAALCAAPRRVFVLDQGDTCAARRDTLTGECDAPGWDNDITDLSKYWRVREFGLLGGDTLTTFTDTSFAFVRGIAADDQGRIYVSGTAIVLIPNVGTGGYTRAFQYRVYRYRRKAASDPVDLYMPGTDQWVRDRAFEVEEGSGVGTLFDPRGLYWAGGSVPGGPALFAADFGKNWGQKLRDDVSSQGVFAIETAQDTSLNGPVDITADLQGFLYVADAGNRRVLRFDPSGGFVQKVNVELDTYGRALEEPVAVAADDSLVYIGDRAAGRVIRYRRRR